LKTIRMTIWEVFSSATVCLGQAITDPGWFNAVSTDAPSQPDGSATPQVADPSTHSEYSPLLQTPSIAETNTPEIQALARGLENDPTRIYWYVHDYIKYVLYFGSKKGAQLTLLDKGGNDFDQCALLVSLLRAAGYSAQYQFGWMGIPYDATDGTENDLHHWLGLNFSNTNWVTTSNYLINLFGTRCYPTTYFLTNDANTLVFQRVWGTVNGDGNTWTLDPSFKPYDLNTRINLPLALGFSSSARLSSALSIAAGGTAGPASLSGVNAGNI